MDEGRIFTLISQGESSTLDFKESLSLDNAGKKAEFIKDVLSIANSSPDEGYILIGVDDNQRIVGIAKLEEERIQQILRAYITPPINIKCDLLPIASAGFLRVGIISVQGTNRPHKVARTIDKIYQDDVFVRHGSVVSKASPEEIIQMHLYNREVLQYTRAAETHARLGNLENAIAAYSKAIEVAPSAELLFARAQTILNLRKERKKEESWESLEPMVEKSLKDLNDALMLTDSESLKNKVRKLRWDFSYSSYKNYTDEQSDADYEYFKNQLDGQEFGKWIYEEMMHRDLFVDDFKKTLSVIEDAIESGYQVPEIYEFLARTHIHMKNYGLALEVVERLINDEAIDNKHLAYNLGLKAQILVELEMYREAFNISIQAAELKSGNQGFYSIWHFAEDIIFRCILTQYFGSEIYPPMNKIFLYLIYFIGRNIQMIETSSDGTRITKWETQLDEMEKKFPGLKQLIHEYIGDENWNLLMDINQPINLNLNLPSLQEFINDETHTFITVGKSHRK